jgi:ribosomal protein S12 methylthiotransferase
VPEALKEERRARLMQLQAQISAERLRRKVGKRIKVLVDEPESAARAPTRRKSTA